MADVSLNSWSPSNDPTRIPEVRHNIRLIAEACKTDLDGLAREAKALDERKKWVTHEDARLRNKVADEAECMPFPSLSSHILTTSLPVIARLQQVQIVANEIDTKSKELASSYEVSLEEFSPLFYKLVDQFSREFERYRLDEIVVAAIAPLVSPFRNLHSLVLIILVGPPHGRDMGPSRRARGFSFYVPKLAARPQGQYRRGKTRADASRRVRFKDRRGAA